MADDLPYQQAAQVRQLLAERENAVAYKQGTTVDRVDKQLAELGYKTPKGAEQAAGKAEDAAVNTPEEERATPPEERAAQPKEEPPKGRTASSPKRTTAEGKSAN
jgi:hypothetical protein